MGSTNNNSNICLLVLFILLITICLPSVVAEEYYADVNIEVDNLGFIKIDGITNHPDLLVDETEIYTSKDKGYWLLNFTKEEIFSDFVYVLTLPKGSSINYLKSSGSIRIEENLGTLIVRGFGENKTFSVVVQYQIEKLSLNNFLTYYNLILIIIVILILIIIVIIFMRFKIGSKSKDNIGFKGEINLKGLNERQKKIIKVLGETDRAMTQTDIQKKLKIPKAAVSRNILGLERKGLIEKEQIGMSNLIRLKKP
jgi:uncharacterized membrane protein